MTIDEFKKDRRDLEQEIYNLISAFEAKFGSSVEYVELRHADQIGSPITKVVEVKLTVVV